MTRERVFGSDTPFCEWMRHCKVLPSKSIDCGFVALDSDLTVHRYMTEVDGVGTREIQALLHVETKTRNGEPERSQQDTLFKIHKSCCGYKSITGQFVIHYGVAVLSMDGTTPEDSSVMRWGRFDAKGNLMYQGIQKETLIRLLRFEVHPDTLSFRPFRRHHKTQELYATVKTPLGFSVDHFLVKRS